MHQKMINYKGINLAVPKKSHKYLNLIYGKKWKKKAEFYSVEN